MLDEVKDEVEGGADLEVTETAPESSQEESA